ncbi:MAG: OsmC family protein [Caldilineaceae bacterium]
MQNFPHHYQVIATGGVEDTVTVTSAGLPSLQTASPPEFDGPPGLWSPETLLTAAVANCFILTFRAVARASKLEWGQIECKALGVLDRIERVTRFTEMQIHVKLQLPAGSDAERAKRIIEKSEQACLITNSLNAKMVLEAEVIVG